MPIIIFFLLNKLLPSQDPLGLLLPFFLFLSNFEKKKGRVLKGARLVLLEVLDLRKLRLFEAMSLGFLVSF